MHLPEEHAKVRALRLEQLARRSELLHLRHELRGHGVGLALAHVEECEVVLALGEHLHRGREARRARHLQPQAPSCNRTHAGSNRMHPGCNRTHAGCSLMLGLG